MKLVDSRRLTGPGLMLSGPGAVLDVSLEGRQPDEVIAAWRSTAQRLLDDVGWTGERLATRMFAGGVSLALTAPVDALYAATELNERAWDAAAASLGEAPPRDYASDLASIRFSIASESNPTLVALRQAARAASES